MAERAPAGRGVTAAPGPALVRNGHSPPSPAVVEAKLAPPVLRRGVLPRHAIVRRLCAATDERIVALVAPPGYGKSTLLALWRACEARPVAWVTVDDADADPIRLLAHVVVAIDRAVGLDPAVLASIGAPRTAALSVIVPRLTSALHREGRPLVVMLDDVHHLAGSPAVDAVAMLVDYLPHQATVALAGRTDAGLPLARFRAAGTLLEVDAARLALDPVETAALFEVEGSALRNDEARELHAKTEGWPAAVYLAARTAAGRRAAGLAAAVTISGTDRDIAGYLNLELLGATSRRVRQFLLQTSILDRLTGELCDAIVGRSGSDRVLRDLAATNRLVVALDTEGGWYRYHALLREHLAAELGRSPGRAVDLHRRAAAWYASQDLVDEAIRHHLRAGDPEAAAAQATRSAMQVYREGRGATISRWLDQLGQDVLGRHPYLTLMGAWLRVLQGRAAEAERMMDLADAAGYGPERPAGAESFEAARAAVRALMARRGMAAAQADAEWAVARVPVTDPWRPTSLVVLGALLGAVGETARAASVLDEAATVAASAGADRALVVSRAWQALLAIERDDWAAADALVRDGLRTVVRYDHEADATVATVTAVAARVAIRRGDVGEARRQLADFQVARMALGPATPWLSVGSLLEAALAHLALADPAGARAALHHAEDILVRRPDLGPQAARVAALRERMRRLPPGPGGASTLTPAEVRVLRLLPTYLSAPEMAERLYVTPNTVKTQIQAIYGKLGASSRAQAVERAIEVGLLEPLPALAGKITST